MTTASIHKVNRNNHYKIELSGTTVITATVSDNGFINRILPFYKESSKWFKSYLSTPASFVNYVLFSATYTGSSLTLPSQEVLFISPRFSDYRKNNSSLYDNLNHKEHQELRLGDLAKIKRDQENNNVYIKTKPLIHNNQSLGEEVYSSFREPPIDYSSELIKYNINDEVDGYTSVYDMDFAHQVLNEFYNNRNKEKKYRKLDAILRFNGDVKIAHRQTVYPNQNDIWDRTRPYFSFDSWNSNQDYRIADDYEYSSSIGLSDYKSVWPLDFFVKNLQAASRDHVFGEYITASFDMFNPSYVLQSYYKPFRFTHHDIYLERYVGGATSASFYRKLTGSIWTVPEETNSFPFFDSEKLFLQNIKSKYKNFSSIPEYLVSNFINDYSIGDGNYDLYLSGTSLENEQIFSNNDSELKNIFNIKKEINKDILKVKFDLHHVNLFRPYRNLYPVEKILQLSKILLQNIQNGVVTGTISGNVGIISNQQYIENFLMEPFVSPGVLWNTIKTGVPAQWPYLDTYQDRTDGIMSSSFSFPFESIFNPLKYLISTEIYSYNGNNSFNNIGTASYSGSSYDEKYEDCIKNFIEDSSDFFLRTTKNFKYFSSKRESDFDVFLSGTTYGMIISLDNYFNSSSTTYSPISSISPSPFSLGPFDLVATTPGPYVETCLMAPPYLGYYKDQYPSSPTYNKIKIVFTPTDTGKYTLPEIISSSVVTREITDSRWLIQDQNYLEQIKNNGQNLLKSYNIFEFERFDDNNRIWNISGKWEVPIFDFREADSKITNTSYRYFGNIIGYGHQFGKQQNGEASLSLNVKDISGSYSLADAVGFKNRSYLLGKLKEIQEVNELICVVPFNSSKSQLISIDREDNNYNNINYFDHYLFPVKYDYKYGSASPYLMYCFETSMNLYSDDLSKIWQNVMPSQSFNHEEGMISITDDIINNPKLNMLFEDNISWMIFKVKKRSLSNQDGKHTFNWPYDNFSITELARLDVELTYDDIKNFKSTLDPSAIGKKAKQKSSRDVEIFDKEETKKRIFPVKGPETPQEPIPNQEQQDPNRVFPVKQPEPTTEELINLGEQWRFVSIPDDQNISLQDIEVPTIPEGYSYKFGFLTRDPNVIDVTNRR